ncbi:MAG: M23 family metallopeptidase, partial [Chitinophagales bacterium]|nr:M23 family metallopeptidase [Chitinophagales bacterium]
YQVTQTFGNKLILNGVDVYAKWGYLGHNGIDYGTPTGTPILAPHSGKVIEAAFDQYGYGNYVKIENNTEGSVLAHFSKTEVSVGQEVKEGQRIALSGNTGNSTGPHLHWGYYRHPRNRQNGYGGFIDQTPY